MRAELNDKPNEDAITPCDGYFNLISDVIAKCHGNLRSRPNQNRKKKKRRGQSLVLKELELMLWLPLSSMASTSH